MNKNPHGRRSGFLDRGRCLLRVTFGGGSFCFHFLTVAWTPNKKRCCKATREAAVVPHGFSKATTREEAESGP